MYNFGGIEIRIWTIAGIVILCGICCILLSHVGKSNFEKETFFVGIAAILFGIGYTIHLLVCLYSPKVIAFQGAFYDSRQDNSIASPAAFGNEYTFSDKDDVLWTFYLDTGMMNEILPEGFQVGQEYIVYYEEREKVIVGIEEVTNK